MTENGVNQGVVLAIKKAKNQNRLAKRVGCSVQAIIKARDINCTGEMALRISNATGVPLRRFGWHCKYP